MEGANVDMVVKVESNDLDLLPTEADGPCDSSPGSGRSLGDDETMIHCSISVSTETRVDGFLQREAKRMARNSCLYFWISLIASISLSFVAILQGGLSIEASSQGWTTRGTTIADRQTASILVRMNRKYLSSGGEDAWNDLTNNIQPSWESVRTDDTIKHQKTARRERHRDDNRHRRRLPRGPRGTSFDNLDLDEDDQENAADWYPNMMRHRKLNETMHNTLGSCASRVYNSADFQWLPKLWPVWKSTSGKSLLSPDHLHELCVAEEKTQQVLSQNNLCVRCEQSCLPPFSIVLFARLTIPNGFGLTCEELHEAWKPYRKSTEAKLKSCVADLEDSASVAAGVDASLPMSCPFGFSSHMVDLNFLETGVLLYTSSIFVTDSEKLAEIYSLIGQFDRGGQSVAGAYDTQKQNFNLRFQNEVLKRDIALAFGSAVIVIAAIFVHTRSIFITFVGILQIGLCFPLAHFVYVFVAGYSFFPILNFLGIFVAFALGADDVFVAVDKWKNARLDDKTASTIEIAAVALPDAAKAMLLTTLTTSLAFFATGVCPVAPIKLFANFVGILVMLVYCLCILLVFPALCLRDKALQKSTDIICLDDKPSRCEDRSNKETTDFPGTHSSLIRRLMTGYHQFIWKYRYFSLFVCLVILASCIYSTTMLEPTRSLDVRLLDESTEFERNYQWRQQLLHEDLLKSVGSLSYVFWGVNPVDNGDHSTFKKVRMSPS